MKENHIQITKYEKDEDIDKMVKQLQTPPWKIFCICSLAIIGSVFLIMAILYIMGSAAKTVLSQ